MKIYVLSMIGALALVSCDREEEVAKWKPTAELLAERKAARGVNKPQESPALVVREFLIFASGHVSILERRLNATSATGVPSSDVDIAKLREWEERIGGTAPGTLIAMYQLSDEIEDLRTRHDRLQATGNLDDRTAAIYLMADIIKKKLAGVKLMESLESDQYGPVIRGESTVLPLPTN